MPGKSNIVLLATDSRESIQKARFWKKAARALGLKVRDEPDRSTLSILPCSDYKLIDAAWLCSARRISGPSPVAATIASSKALACEFLRSRGFEMLFTAVPVVAADLNTGFNRPVIVKPERGSGTYAAHHWSYKVFDGMGDFRRYLEKTRSKRQFLQYQQAPHSVTGRYLVMEFVETRKIVHVESILGDEDVVTYDQRALWVQEGSMTVESTLWGEKFSGGESIARMAREFAQIGLRRTTLMIQCVRKLGALCPIDFNFRTSVLQDLFVDKLGLDFFEQALAFFLGLSRDFTFIVPKPRVGTHRMYLPRRRGRFEVKFAPGCIPLITEASYDPKKPYDVGSAWPAFAVLCDGERDFFRKIERIVSTAAVSRTA